MVATLLQAGNRWGETALHVAAGAGHAHVCALLLRLGASAAAVDTWGRTPLTVAREQGAAAAAIQVCTGLAAAGPAERAYSK